MNPQASTSNPGLAGNSNPAWGAVFAMALGAFALVASEFMPVSLLTPVAADLGISEGRAGQAISVSGAFALVTSLFMAPLAGRLDRKVLLLALTLMMIVSSTVAAFAPNYTVFMIGRAFIGVAIGGFWSMSAATAMRLVPPEQVPRALAILNGGNALATVVAAPLGSFLGGVIGWRGAFFCLVPVAAVALAWKFASLPALPSQGGQSLGAVFRLLRRPAIALGMAGVSLFFMGQFALYTYLRPFLETVTHAGVTTLSLLLLLVGVAGFVGTTLIGGFLKGQMYRTLVAIPLLMAIIAGGRRPAGLGQLGGGHRRPALPLGLGGDRGAGGLVDLAGAKPAAGSRSRRRLDGGGGAAGDCRRRDPRRPAVRCARPCGHIQPERGHPAAGGAAGGTSGARGTA